MYESFLTLQPDGAGGRAGLIQYIAKFDEF